MFFSNAWPGQSVRFGPDLATKQASHGRFAWFLHWRGGQGFFGVDWPRDGDMVDDCFIGLKSRCNLVSALSNLPLPICAIWFSCSLVLTQTGPHLRLSLLVHTITVGIMHNFKKCDCFIALCGGSMDPVTGFQVAIFRHIIFWLY